MPNRLHFFMQIVIMSGLVFGQNFTGEALMRLKRQYDDGPDSFHSLGGVNEDGKARAPLLLQVTHNLTQSNGPKGRCGVCVRTYRVLNHLQYKPSVECQRHSDSRQAALGDLTEFYHTLYHSRKQRDTLTFMLSDVFPDFSIAASIISSAPGDPPFLMLEAAKSAEQALCVQSYRCPEDPVTSPTLKITTTTIPTATPKPIDSPPLILQPLVPASNLQIGEDKAVDSDSGRKHPPSFWDAVMANSSPRIWVVATLVLACISLILLGILVCTCVWACRTKRSFHRKRCRGTCRFGCKCNSDIIRQVAADAAVCGPIEGLGNSSLLTYPSVGRSWGFSSSVKAPINPLYVSLASNEKMLSVAQGSGTPPSQQMYPAVQQCPVGSWQQYTMSGSKGLIPKDLIYHSHSDGSSLSENTAPSGVGSGPSGGRIQHSRLSGQPTSAYPCNANPSSATASTCIPSYVGAVSGQGDMGGMGDGSPARLEDADSARQNGIDHNGITTQPTELRGLSGVVFDQGTGDVVETFAQHSELTSITPPVGFYDVNGQPTVSSKLDQSWTYGGNLQSSMFATSGNQSGLGCGIKVHGVGTNAATINYPNDYKRRNGYLSGNDGPFEDTSMRRRGLNSHILSHPLTEGVEQSYHFERNSDTPLRAWTDALAH